jgi:hypothetical protein
MENIFQFIEDLLGPADAEGRNQYSAPIAQSLIDHRLQSQSPLPPVFMPPVTIGAFQHQQISAHRWSRSRQQRGPRCPQVTGKNQSFADPGLFVDKIALDISRTENMTGPLQPDAYLRCPVSSRVWNVL